MSITSLVSGGISTLGSSASSVTGAVNSAGFTNSAQGIMDDMQNNQLAVMKQDAQFQHANALANSFAQAGSAAAQVKIQY